MQFATILSTFGIFSVALAAPSGDMSTSQLEARTNSKLNQYAGGNCLAPNGDNIPTYRATPPARKCYNVDSTTVSFFWTTGSTLTQAWAYSNTGCSGQSFNMQGAFGPCATVAQNISPDFQTIKSIMMD